MTPDRPGALRTWWHRQQFAPGAAGLLVNPFYFARRGLRDGLREFLPGLGDELLDIGCGRKPYRDLARAKRYVGIDVDTAATRALAAADFYFDGRELPFPEASFDAVLSSQVLEHVFTPEKFLAEAHRVLRPGGKLLLATPLVWDEHEQPFDFARYSSFGLRSLVARAGFEIIAQRKTCADFRVVVQLASAYLYKCTLTRNRWVNRMTQLLLIAPVNVAGAALALILPANPDLYLDNIVLARKPADRP